MYVVLICVQFVYPVATFFKMLHPELVWGFKSNHCRISIRNLYWVNWNLIYCISNCKDKKMYRFIFIIMPWNVFDIHTVKIQRWKIRIYLLDEIRIGCSFISDAISHNLIQTDKENFEAIIYHIWKMECFCW